MREIKTLEMTVLIMKEMTKSRQRKYPIKRRERGSRVQRRRKGRPHPQERCRRITPRTQRGKTRIG